MQSRGEQVMTTVKPATRIDRTYARCYSNGTGSSLLKDELKFLQSFYASETHGVLSIESGCRRFCELYRSMDAGSKMELLRHIAENYGVDQTVIVNVAQRVIDIQWLLSKSATSVSETDRAHLTSLQLCLKELLSLWFTMGFLRLERLTWQSPCDVLQKKVGWARDGCSVSEGAVVPITHQGFLRLERLIWQSPCDVLQKISEFEAVHPVRHWADLKRRVGPYRRCFVFTHTSMPREPIVSILERPGGLHGVDLGNYLIKRAAGELAREWPQITQFSSISPIPGFREWLLGEINRQIAALKDGSREGSAHLLTLEEVESICSISNTSNDILLALLHVKELINDHIWTKSPQTSQTLKPLLMRLCSQYLYKAKRRGYALNSVGKMTLPRIWQTVIYTFKTLLYYEYSIGLTVLFISQLMLNYNYISTLPNFHLQNGAVLWRLNWAADMTSRGLENSCGLMANYRYFLNDTVTNSQRYIESGYICASEQVLLLCG
ncbi:DCMC-like protein [Mya arenaria]|uniref:DCMC-like protein n=1 Tax=Mya arenaria TaxID=6604 RepID=A0ABY7EEA6_MYAAR|nr:DCMC-like protein [Mya arenaria]